MKRHFLFACAIVPLVATISVFAQRGGRGGGAPAGPPNPFRGNAQAVEEGRTLYNGTCTVCHGPDGTAGEMGPALGEPARRYAQGTDQQIFDAIKNGIQGTPMPPFGDKMSDEQIQKVAAYIIGLRGTAVDAPLPGDVAAGEQIFWGKGECGTCHVIKGKGGLIGPDLTNIAGTRKAASIVAALTKEQHRVFGDGGAIPRILIPNTTYQTVHVTTADGKTVTGVLKNEDSYSLQIMGTDNQLHMFERAKVKVAYDQKSMMPSDYDKRLSADELKNLLAFLTRQAVAPPAAPPSRRGGGPPAEGQ
jgi:putative heme-binding domain-containing protein